MGKPIVKHPCLRCGKEFWTKPKKNKDGDWEVVQYCQGCRNKVRQEEQRKKKGEINIMVVENKVNLRRRVNELIWLENRHPQLVDKIRGKKVNEKKKEKSSKSSRSKKKVKG